MPNQPAEVGRGVIVHAAAAGGRGGALSTCCRGLGSAIEMPEETMEAAMAVMSCSPAYVALFAEALADAGAQDGLEPALSLELVAGTLEGTASLLRERDPETIRNAVASPGGATEAGLDALSEGGGFRGDRERRRRFAGEVPMMLLAALDRGDVANYVDALFTVFLILIITRVDPGLDPDVPPDPLHRPAARDDRVRRGERRPLPERLPALDPADRWAAAWDSI